MKSKTAYHNGLAGFWSQDTGEFVPYHNQYPKRGGGGNYGPEFRGPQGGGGGQRPVKKHSGAKSGVNSKGSAKGKQNITGWNYSRNGGLLTFIATSYKDTDKHKSKSGRVWENWMVSWFNKTTKAKGVVSGLYDTTTGKLIINDWGWVVNPKAPNGGYSGKFTKK